jgi:hypothetical protein
VRRDPSRHEVHEALAGELLDALDARMEPCSGDAAPACATEARRSVAFIKADSGFRRVMLGARLHALEGDRVGAVRTLLDECPAAPSAMGCLELAVDLAAGRVDTSLVRQAVGRLIAVACEVAERCVATHRRVAERFEANGELAGALEHHTAAARQKPSAELWLEVAEVAARLGAAARARNALAEVRALGPLDEAQRRQVARLEQSSGAVNAPP